MEVKDRIVYNILKQLDKMNNDDKFKESFPGILAQEYLYAKVHTVISANRLNNILHGNIKRIKTEEVICIAKALNVRLDDLVK